MAKAYLGGGYSMPQIASYLVVHYVTAGRAVRRYENSQYWT